MSNGLIRWLPDEGGSLIGCTGSLAEAAFKVVPPDLEQGETEWLLSSRLTGRFSYGPGAGEMKQQAEEALRKYVSSLGALFAADLRAHLERQAQAEQELGDSYSEGATPQGWNEAYGHWGKAEALREVIGYIEHELETR